MIRNPRNAPCSAFRRDAPDLRRPARAGFATAADDQAIAVGCEQHGPDVFTKIGESHELLVVQCAPKLDGVVGAAGPHDAITRDNTIKQLTNNQIILLPICYLLYVINENKYCYYAAGY